MPSNQAIKRSPGGPWDRADEVGGSMDDRGLVEALRSGDRDAPRALVERFHDVVFGLCFRMLRHRQDAEDVVQETFLRALRGIRGFDGARPLRPWLLGIAANRCRTSASRRVRLPNALEVAEEAVDHRPPLGDPDGLAHELQSALERLRPDYRMVFVLFHEQGLPYEEIAESIGRPVGTVKTWLHRARAELAEHLARKGIQCP